MSRKMSEEVTCFAEEEVLRKGIELRSRGGRQLHGWGFFCQLLGIL